MFIYEDIKDPAKRERSKRALGAFCETGRIIRSTDYNETVLCSIEKILSGDLNTLNSHLGRKHPDLLTDQSLNGTFIALAAPSLEGKTQSAFVFEDVLPLYFPLQISEDAEQAQAIYRNYASLSTAVEKNAKKDLMNFIGKESGLTDQDYKNISRFELLRLSPDKKSFV